MKLSMWSGVLLSAASAVVAPVCADGAGCGPFQYYKANYDEDVSASLKAAFANIDEWVEALALNLQAPSVSFGIVYDQELVHYTSTGYTNLQTKQKPTADSIYRIGSISKVWTVLVAYKLREHGLISFDDPIAKFNPQFTVKNPWGISQEEKTGKTLTIQQLASQVSGLPREAPCELGIDCTGHTTRDILQRLASETLVHPTDVQPSYSNLAFAILGNVLSEYIGDTSFNHTLFDTIISPLGLNNTGLYLTPEQKSYATTGYAVDGQEVEYIDLGWLSPAGQLFSSVHDLASLMMQYFAAFPSLYEREIDSEYKFMLRPQTLREMLRPVFLNPDETTGFGAPWEIFWRKGHMVRSKGGAIDGFRSEIAMIPEMKLGLVILVNTIGVNVDVMASSAFDILVPAFEAWTNEQRVEKVRAPQDANFKDVVGIYGVEGQALVKIYLDDISGLPMITAPLLILHGVLTPANATFSLAEQDDASLSFVYNDMYSNPESCFTATLDAFDGLLFVFVDKRNGQFQAFRADGMFYGTELTRMEERVDLPLEYSSTKKESFHWLRGVMEPPRMGLRNPFHRDILTQLERD